MNITQTLNDLIARVFSPTRSTSLVTKHKSNVVYSEETKGQLAEFSNEQNQQFKDEWLWQYVPLYIVGRPVESMEVLARYGQVVLLAITPSGTTIKKHAVDPIIPVVCLDELLNNDQYTYAMQELIKIIQNWVEKRVNGLTASDQEEFSYMENVKTHGLEAILAVYNSSLSDDEYDLFKTWLRLFTANPFASLKLAEKALNAVEAK